MKGALLVNHYLKGDKFDDLNKWMQKSADKARVIAKETIARCKKAMGLL